MAENKYIIIARTYQMNRIRCTYVIYVYARRARKMQEEVEE